MRTLENILKNTYLTSLNIILADDIPPRLSTELLWVGKLMDEALFLSGAVSTEADNMVESFARLDAERELAQIANEVIDHLDRMGLTAHFETYKIAEPANDYYGDLDFHKGTGLQITLEHQHELFAA